MTRNVWPNSGLRQGVAELRRRRLTARRRSATIALSKCRFALPLPDRLASSSCLPGWRPRGQGHCGQNPGFRGPQSEAVYTASIGMLLTIAKNAGAAEQTAVLEKLQPPWKRELIRLQRVELEGSEAKVQNEGLFI